MAADFFAFLIIVFCFSLVFAIGGIIAEGWLIIEKIDEHLKREREKIIKRRYGNIV